MYDVRTEGEETDRAVSASEMEVTAEVNGRMRGKGSKRLRMKVRVRDNGEEVAVVQEDGVGDGWRNEGRSGSGVCERVREAGDVTRGKVERRCRRFYIQGGIIFRDRHIET